VVLVEGSKFAAASADAPRLGFRVGSAVALAAGVLLWRFLSSEFCAPCSPPSS